MVKKGSPLYDSQGTLISIGAELGRGGEGSVFDVIGKHDLVAKLYHQSDVERSRKISAMRHLKNDRLSRYAAWPIDTLHENAGGPVVGFLMPKVKGYKDIHLLYGPKTRMAEFTDAGLPFLVHTAANIARAFAVVHEAGQVVGDVNHSNIMVSDKGTIIMIDCDSFQITQNNQQYRCAVGVSTHQPPEFQAISLRDVNRTANHDNFGLAVLIFQTLFMGRHPFSGRFLGSGDMPIEKAITEYRFAYGHTAASNQMKQPPGTLPLDIYSSEIAQLFVRAFSSEGSKMGMRPQAVEWISALDNLGRNLKTCVANKGHSYPATLTTCPWCEFESKAGLVFFSPVFANTTLTASKFQLEEIWARISKVPEPQGIHVPSPSAFQVSPSDRVLQSIQKQQKDNRSLNLFAGLIGAVSLGFLVASEYTFFPILGLIFMLFLFVNANKEISDPFYIDAEKSYLEAQNRWRTIQERLQREGGSEEFQKKREELRRLYNTYRNVPNLRKQKMNVLESNRRSRQLNDFLDKHFLSSATISNIGPGRKISLQSYGIETARDITKQSVMNVPGFGPALTNNLLEWRRSVESKFVFDPTKAVSKSDVQVLDKEIFDIKAGIEKKLLAGEEDLKRIAHHVSTRQNALKRELERYAEEFAQAEANWKAVQWKNRRTR